MLTRFFMFFVALLFCVTVFAQDAAHETEAARFAGEAEFLHSQGRYEAALEAAEAAVALDPENIELRQVLIKALIYRGMHLLQPSGRFSRGGRSLLNIELETAHQAFHLAGRVLEIGESLGDRDSFREFHRKPNGDASMAIFQWYLHHFAAEQHPEMKPEAIQFSRRLRNHWLAHRFRPMISQIHNTESCEETLRILISESHFFINEEMLPITDFADAFEETMGAMLRLTIEWNVDPARFFDIRNTYTKWHCREFIKMATSHPDVSLPQIERTIALLENDSRPMFRYYGWVARNRPNLYFFASDFPQKNRENPHSPQKSLDLPQRSEEYFTKLLKLLDEQPPGMSFGEGDIYYDELCYVVSRISELSRYHFAPLVYYERILETANQRHEVVPSAVVWNVWGHLRTINGDHDYFQFVNRDIELTRLLEIEQRFKLLITRQIELAESTNRQTFEYLRQVAIEYGMITEPEPAWSKPWISETIYELGQNDSWIYDAVLRGETLYLFKTTGAYDYQLQRHILRRRMDQLDIRTGNIKSSKEMPFLEGGTTGFSENSTGNSVFVDDRNAYFGGVSTGILVFPLDGSEPWLLTEEDGLPSNDVQALGSIGGKLYAGLGHDGYGKGHPSWLVTVDLKTKGIEILSSSSGREGKVPFYNLSPAPYFSFFLEDAKRNRLLLFVDGGSNEREIGGLWAIDETGNFEQIKRFQCSARSGQLLADGDHIMVFASRETFLMNLNDTNRDTLPQRFTSANFRNDTLIPSPSILYGTLFNRYFWGSANVRINGKSHYSHWTRIPFEFEPVAELKMLEELQYPGQDRQQMTKSFRALLPMPDGKRLVVCGDYEIFILHFE